jgi:malate dehydrogenase (oxaloacetate-decarboxylating)(NADP+)
MSPLLLAALITTSIPAGAYSAPRQPPNTKTSLSGYQSLKDPTINKGLSTCYPADGKVEGLNNIRGLVPKGCISQEQQVERLMTQLRAKATPLEKYIYLQSLQDTSEKLYFSLLTQYTAELMPIVYTPTVGEACQKWSQIYREQPRGLYIGMSDKGHVRDCLDNWPNDEIKVIVVTDGERILGLGDLGCNGMGIPIGKLALYTACAGIRPEKCLPIMLDVGTNTASVREDKDYIGVREPRPADQDPEYYALIEELFTEARDKYGDGVLIQFEDFGNGNAFHLLEEWTPKATCFNDDIQGTAVVVLGGLLGSERMVGGRPLQDHTFMFLGAGEAGVGIANLIAEQLKERLGCTLEEAHSKIWLVDSGGLVCDSRTGLAHHKQPYAHSAGPCESLIEAVKQIQPSALIGVSGQGGAFTEEVIRAATAAVPEPERPFVLALSNPTVKAECTAAQAYEWSDGRAVFVSGSPFDPVEMPDGSVRVPGQGNNAYVFPGIGLGALACGATILNTDDMLVAANALADQISESDLEKGSCYPPLSTIRDVSAKIAVAVCENQYAKGTASIERPEGDLLAHVQSLMYDPFE